MWVKQNACNMKWIFQSKNVFELESYIAFDMNFFFENLMYNTSLCVVEIKKGSLNLFSNFKTARSSFFEN